MTTMTKKIGLAASLAVVSSFSFADNNYDLGSLLPTPEVDTFGFNGNFIVDTSGYFTDTFTFTLPSTSPDGVLIVGAHSQGSLYPLHNDVMFADFSLMDSSGMAYVPWANGLDAPQVTTFGAIYYPVGPGDYSLSLTGEAFKDGATYDVNLYSHLAPVPEPSTIAMMLGGLGLVAFMAARRRKQA